MGHYPVHFPLLSALQPHTNTDYLQDDCLHVIVKTVVVYCTPLLPKIPAYPQSLCEFTVTEFSKRKRFDNEYYTPPFYTHTQGYKMCIRLNTNGSDSGKGSHISCYVFLMRREYDHQLRWPFEGDIIVELLYWRANLGHHKMTVEFNRLSHTANYACCVRVTTEGVNTGLGIHQFIPHSSLPCNPATDTEYLQDDCLRLRVNAIVKSLPLRSVS